MRIAFIGLGNMGGGMAANQAKAGHDVLAFDLSTAALERARETGCRTAASVADAVRDADAVITMLPAGPHVRQVYADEVFPNATLVGVLITNQIACSLDVTDEQKNVLRVGKVGLVESAVDLRAKGDDSLGKLGCAHRLHALSEMLAKQRHHSTRLGVGSEISNDETTRRSAR